MSESKEADVIVVGAGPAGLSAALGCLKAGLSPAVVDTSQSASNYASKGRSAALFNKTIAFLDHLGVWDGCKAHAEPLKTLQFIDDTGRRFRAPDCVFHAEEIGETAFGYNITNADLAAAFKAEAERRNLPIAMPGPLTSFRETASKASLRFADGTELRAPLAIAADGRMSATREAAGIRKLTWAYDQIAMAATFAHERPHRSMCIEFHRSAGPFTLVPLPGNSSGFVWVERKATAEALLALDDQEFAREIEKASHMALGRVFDVSDRARFPLSSLAVNDYGRLRVALVGEAAHVVPPIGAQGLNLGFRDVETLLGLLAAAKEKNEDLGSDTLLRAYSAARRGDILSRTAGADILNRSLLSNFLPLQAARSFGLYALGSIGPLRRAFMRRGMAPVGFV